jgi:hypothetical protein
MALARASLAEGADSARELLARPDVEAVEIGFPPLDELPYRDFARALLGRQGFKLEFGGETPDSALALVAERLFEPGAYARERELLVRDIAELKAFMQGLAGGPPPLVAIRTYFAPGDLVWHLDRMAEPSAFRLVWPIGRPAGMRVTPASNIDEGCYRAFMRREHALLGRLDTHVLRTGEDVRSLWAHRPRQLEALTSGRFPFLIDAERHWEISPGAASIHRVQTPEHPGTYHRSSWENHSAPGLQIVVTAASAAA